MTADFVWGAKAIADFLREECGVLSATPKLVYHWAERSVIPVAMLNRTLVISRAAVIAHFNSAVDAAVERCRAEFSTPPLEIAAASLPSPNPPEAPPTRARGPRHRIR
jgi:hypothetical protein